MATIKVKFRPSSIPTRKGIIYYQILHDRKPRQLLTDYQILPSEWDANHSTVKANRKSDRKELIQSIREKIRWDVERLTKIIRKLDNNDLAYTADNVIEEFRNYADKNSLFNFMEKIIAKHKLLGNTRTSETYKSTLNSFKCFRNNEDIMLDVLSSEIMEAYQAWNLQRGLSLNSISFYIRIIRAVYNRAVEEEIIENRYPFKHVYTGVEKTPKRSLPLSTISKLKELDLSTTPTLEHARDMFLMSFYLRGMSFIDMAFLRKNDLKNGFITYRRRKTKQTLSIEWTKDMQTLLEKYPENKSEYLLPIIKNPDTNERCTYHNVGYNINYRLKTIAKMIDLNVPLTLYVARHSWASAAKAKGVPLSVISEGMGHNSESTTRIYLASLETSLIDKANSLILNSL
ncbi:MAG: site-specific integrase [Muribaculaceae bacterium]|nr:site-specific integrase [Muribaculaceae bacterium]